jgi:hypothetical protein
MYTQRFLKSCTFFVHEILMKGRASSSSAARKETHPDQCVPAMMRRL